MLRDERTCDVLQLADMYNADVNCTADVAAAELQLWFRELVAQPDNSRPKTLSMHFACVMGRYTAVH